MVREGVSRNALLMAREGMSGLAVVGAGGVLVRVGLIRRRQARS